MRYQGSKARLAKHIIPIITQNLTEDKYFIDLFGGGMNIVCDVNHKKKVACDYNSFVIDLWNDIKANGMSNIPNVVSLDDYKEAKKEYLNGAFKYFSRAQIGYISHCCSYGGGFFNGYAHFNPKKNEDHIKEAYNGLSKQVDRFKYLESTKFLHIDYREVNTLMNFCPVEKMVIYADPPYASTKKYESDFNNLDFWQWVRQMVIKYNAEIYISEYDAPDDFKCIWEKSVADGMGTTNTGKKQKRKIEKLFVYNGTR